MYSVDCCSHNIALPSLSSEDDFSKQLTAMVQQVWHDKGMPEGLINKEVTGEFAKRLWVGITEGYGDKAKQFNAGSIDWDTPDFKMLASLQKNVWHFSAAKNYTQLRELSNALIGEDGKLRTERDFLQAALKINEKQVKQHLKAEYQLAVVGSQASRMWADYDDDAILEFDAVMDGRTTDLCRKLNGTRLPKSDPFWNIYFIPNHFGERSTIRQVYGKKITPHNEVPHTDIPAMFQTNLAKNGLVFPEGHSYYKDLPKEVEQGAMSALRKELTDVAKNRLHNKNVDVDGVGKVEFSNTSIKEIFNQPHSEYLLKNQLATISNLLLENASLIKTMPDTKGKSINFHYLKVNGLNDNFILVVRQMLDGRNVMYSIVDGIK